MKALLVLVLTLVTTTVFAEAGLRCNLNDLKRAQKKAIKQEVAKQGGSIRFPNLIVHAPQAVTHLVTDGITYYPVGSMEYNNPDYMQILEGNMIYVTLNSRCQMVKSYFEEISPE